MLVGSVPIKEHPFIVSPFLADVFQDKFRGIMCKVISNTVVPLWGGSGSCHKTMFNVSLYLNLGTVLPNHPNYADVVGVGQGVGVVITVGRGNRMDCEGCL
jgi:hypothetical protein